MYGMQLVTWFLVFITSHVVGDSIGDILVSSGRMYVNDYLESSLSLYKVQLQDDGNLVGYDLNSGSSFWSTGTSGDSSDGYYVSMQGDCNLVLRDENGNAIWSSGTSTSGYDNCYLKIRNDRNIIIYSGNDDIVWQSDTAVSSMNFLCLFLFSHILM